MRRNRPVFRAIRPEDSALAAMICPIVAAHRVQHDDRGEGFGDKDRLTGKLYARKGLAQGIDGEQKTAGIEHERDRGTNHRPRQAEHRHQRHDGQQLSHRGGQLKI